MTTSYKKYMPLLTALLLHFSLFAQQWADVGSADFSNVRAHFPSLVFNPASGLPYVAYVDEHNDYYPTVMAYNGTTWSLLGGVAVATHTSTLTCMAIDGNGIVYAAYLDGVSNTVVVMKYTTATGWAPLTGAVSAGSAAGIAIAVDGNGVAYIAYLDADNNSALTVKKYTGSAWAVVGGGPASPGAAGSFSLAVSTNGTGTTAYVAYIDETLTPATPQVKYSSGGCWTLLGANSNTISSYTASGLSLKLTANAVPYLSYTDGTTGVTPLNAATVQTYSAATGTWAVVGNPRFSPGAAGDMTLALSPGGIPYVAFVDVLNSDKTTVMAYNATSATWVTVGNADFSPGAGWDPSIAISASGVPYVAYMDASTGTYQMTVEKAAAVITPASSVNLCSGGSMVLNANAGTGLTYQWYYNGTAIGGATAASYTASAAGTYTVTETNYAFAVTSLPTVVTVNPAPTAAISPAGPTEFNAGGSVVLNANTGTSLIYQWYKGGTVISGATTASYTATASGVYTVAVTNSYNCTTTSLGVPVTVLPVPIVSPSGSVTACGSQVLTTSSGVTGSTYQWYNGGAAISGATAPSYTATATGTYIVMAITNGVTGTSAVTTVTVNPLPIAVIEFVGPTPAAYCFEPGNNFELFTTNNNEGNTYQWYCGGTAIPGQIYEGFYPGIDIQLPITSVTNTYTVAVTNNGCTATSAGYTLTGIPQTAWNPVISPSSGSGGTIVGCGSVVLSASYPYISASSGIAITYQWSRNDSNIPGATSSSYTATASGYYSLYSTFNGQCTEKNDELITVTIEDCREAAPTDTAGATSNFNVYPNPASNVLTVTYAGGSSISLKLYNALGEAVLTKQQSSASGNYTLELLVSGYTPGMYSLSLTDNGQTFSKKVVIE